MMRWYRSAAEDLSDEGLDRVGVGDDGGEVELRALGALSGGVSYAASGAADERDSGVAAAAEPGERHETDEVAEV